MQYRLFIRAGCRSGGAIILPSFLSSSVSFDHPFFLSPFPSTLGLEQKQQQERGKEGEQRGEGEMKTKMKASSKGRRRGGNGLESGRLSEPKSTDNDEGETAAAAAATQISRALKNNPTDRLPSSSPLLFPSGPLN